MQPLPPLRRPCRCALGARVRANYKAAIYWIAMNDDEVETDLETVARQISVVLVADVWGKDQHRVARDVLRVRAKSSAETG